jgi:hypothetical protein
MHLGFFHLIFNLLSIAPLLERFESEFGTLVTLALFTGRKDSEDRSQDNRLTLRSVWNITGRNLYFT